NTTTAIISDTPDPSVTGQPYVVAYTVTPSAAGTPTGNVIVSDGAGATCTASVATGSCTLASSSVGNRTLTASYAGDANFSSSSGTAPHTVNPSGGVLPAAPSNLSATPAYGSVGRKTVLLRIDLAWQDNSTNETGFAIERWKLSGKKGAQTCGLETTFT